MPSSDTIRIGCSGWNYRHWRGLFYPEKMAAKNWFDFYAEQFDTVEINNSFYRLPKAETFDKWRTQAPPGFQYAIKANRYLTQAKKLKDCAEPVARMMAPVRRASSKPSSRLVCAEASLTMPSAWTIAIGMRSWPILKFCRERSVCAPQ